MLLSCLIIFFHSIYFSLSRHAGPKINASEFTVLIKNSIEFPSLDASFRKYIVTLASPFFCFTRQFCFYLFSLLRRNIDDDIPKDYLAKCKFNHSNETDRYCPIFTLAQIVEMAGENITELSIQVSK